MWVEFAFLDGEVIRGLLHEVTGKRQFNHEERQSSSCNRGDDFTLIPHCSFSASVQGRAFGKKIRPLYK